MKASNRYQRDPRNKRKVKEMTAKLNVNIIHPLRPGKKLLVLDIDYSMCTFVVSAICAGGSNGIPSFSHTRYQTVDVR